MVGYYEKEGTEFICGNVRLLGSFASMRKLASVVYGHLLFSISTACHSPLNISYPSYGLCYMPSHDHAITFTTIMCTHMQEVWECLHWLGSQIQLSSFQPSAASSRPGRVPSWGRHHRDTGPDRRAREGTKGSTGGGSGQYGGGGRARGIRWRLRVGIIVYNCCGLTVLKCHFTFCYLTSSSILTLTRTCYDILWILLWGANAIAYMYRHQ